MNFSEDNADPIIRQHAIHWLVCIESYKLDRLTEVGNPLDPWVLKGNFVETCIYVLRSDKTCIVCFRGTKDVKDLYDDYEITMGRVFPRVDEGIKLVQRILDQNPNIVIHLCGHSLGGAVAREVGSELRLPVITFNAAAPPTSPAINGDNEVNYHIVFDIISAWQSPYVVRIDKGFNPISAWWQRIFTVTALYGSFNDIILSHELSNFSNAVPGKIICGEEETALMISWLNGIPIFFRGIVYASMFGLSGDYDFPALHGCFGKD